MQKSEKYETKKNRSHKKTIRNFIKIALNSSKSRQFRQNRVKLGLHFSKIEPQNNHSLGKTNNKHRNLIGRKKNPRTRLVTTGNSFSRMTEGHPKMGDIVDRKLR